MYFSLLDIQIELLSYRSEGPEFKHQYCQAGFEQDSTFSFSVEYYLKYKLIRI